MKLKYLLAVSCVATFCGFMLASNIYAQRMVGQEPGESVTEWPVGVTVYDPVQAYNGFTLFTSLGGDGTHYLIDMNGMAVHTWKMSPSHYGWLLSNGNLLSGAARKTGLDTAETKTPAVANVETSMRLTGTAV